MKKMLSLLILTILLVVHTVSAANASSPYNPKTGDARFDANLRSVNTQAHHDMGAFAAKMNTTYGVSRAEIDIMMHTHRMSPGDVYMTYRLSRLTGKPVEAVLGTFKDNPGRGWGVIAKRLGIKPGSREFHQLKKGDRAFGFHKGTGKTHGKGSGGEKTGGKGRHETQGGPQMDTPGHGSPGGGHGRGR